MKRRIFKLSCFLLLGAIFNVAVAWGCVAFVDVAPNATSVRDSVNLSKSGSAFALSLQEFGTDVVTVLWIYNEGSPGSFDKAETARLVAFTQTRLRDHRTFELTCDRITRMNSAWNKAYGIDPAIFIRDEDAKAVERKYFAFADDSMGANPRSAIRPTVWLQIVPFLPMAMSFMAGIVAYQFLGWPGWTIGVFAVGALVFLYLGSRWVTRHHFGPLFRGDLRLRGYEICVECGYWLRGLNRDNQNCPECGKPIPGVMLSSVE